VRDSQIKAIEAQTVETLSAGARPERPFEEWIAIVANFAGRLGFTPNALSYTAILPAVGVVYAAATGNFVLCIVLMGLSGLCDLLDGPLARISGKSSKFGSLLDSTLDRFADAAPLVGLCVYYSGHGWAALVPAGTLFAAYTVSYVRARAEGLGISLPPLWMRRTSRMVLIGVALLAAPISLPQAPFPAPFVLLGVGAIGVLSLLASFHALVVAKRMFEAASRTARKDSVKSS
jgi:CDP-diacylglycerol--glycerol-3-phosphate 3-phosphatidyltransferase